MFLQVMLIFLLHRNVEVKGTCQFCYIWQPPTGLNCNPYKNTTLQCTIDFPATIELKIKWFRGNNGIKTEITSGDSLFSIDETIIDNQKTSYLTINTNNISGEYWCQVFYNNEGRLESQHLDVGPESDYDRLDYCSNAQTVEELKPKKCDDVFVMLNDGVSSKNCQDRLSTSNIRTSTMLIGSSSAHSTSTTTSTITIDSSTMPATPSSGTINNRNSSNQFHTILYIAIGLAGVFIFLIIILSLICVGLCLTRSKSNSKLLTNNKRDLTSSTLYPDTGSRPRTSMTTQTEVFMAPASINTTDPTAAVYDSLDADYEDIDNDDSDSATVAPPTAEPISASNPPYHDQGPSTVTSGRKKPPPPLPHTQAMYSEVAPVVPPHHPDQGPITVQLTTGYNKLDHSRPRNYCPKKHSPLLSGYRKLHHLHFTAGNNTLPSDTPQTQSGYANIEIPSLRSISLPNSEYSNLNHSSVAVASSQPTTPTQEKTVRHKYVNLEICEDGSCIQRQIMSDDYHMLADATSEGMFEQEYEFLPTCDIDDSNEPPNLELQPSYRRLIRHDSVIENMSLDSSHSSADFTGPFIFPHMINGSETTSPEPSSHTYRPLDISSMEPQSGYTVVNVKRKNNHH